MTISLKYPVTFLIFFVSLKTMILEENTLKSNKDPNYENRKFFYYKTIEELNEIFYDEILKCKKIEVRGLIEEIAELKNYKIINWSNFKTESFESWLENLFPFIYSETLKKKINYLLLNSKTLKSHIMKDYTDEEISIPLYLNLGTTFENFLSDNVDDDIFLNLLYDKFMATIAKSIAEKMGNISILNLDILLLDDLYQNKFIFRDVYKDCNDMLEEMSLNSRELDILIEDMIEITILFLSNK